MDEPERVDLIVTNFNRNFTGVSATAAAVVRKQRERYRINLIGHPLPGCPKPVSLAEALSNTRSANSGRPVIWHVRRNIEMSTAIVARDLFRLPLKIVFTSSAQRRHSAVPRWLISRMDAVVATTDGAASYVPNVMAVAPHGVDTTRFKPAANRLGCWARSGFHGTIGIATVGRVRPEKGTDIFVEAMIALLPQLPGAKALVIGKTTSEHRGFADGLRSQIAAAGLGDRILFTGEMAPEKLATLLPGLSLMVTVPRYEGYGMTALEAMACAVPVIASDTGNFSDFLAGDTGGVVVDPADADAVAKAALAILGPPGEVDRVGAAARKQAVERFSIDKEVDAIGKVYDALWAGDHSSRKAVAG